MTGYRIKRVLEKSGVRYDMVAVFSFRRIKQICSFIQNGCQGNGLEGANIIS